MSGIALNGTKGDDLTSTTGRGTYGRHRDADRQSTDRLRSLDATISACLLWVKGLQFE